MQFGQAKSLRLVHSSGSGLCLAGLTGPDMGVPGEAWLENHCLVGPDINGNLGTWCGLVCGDGS